MNLRMLLALLWTASAAAAAAPKLPDGIDWVQGPKTVDVGDTAQINLPAGYIFTAGKGTQRLMKMMGNLTSDSDVGFLAPADYFEPEGKSARARWFVVFMYEDIGHVSDAEKSAIDKDKLLAAKREGVVKSNEIRAREGLPQMELLGWAVDPHYEEATHNLEWGLLLKTVEQPAGGGKAVEYRSVNYDVRLLGREGVMQCTLVLGPKELKSSLPQFRDMLTKFSYKEGKKYAEWRQGDRIAEVGLTALIAGGAGVAAFKLGAFKYLWKFLVLGVAAFASFFKRLWNRLFGRQEAVD